MPKAEVLLGIAQQTVEDHADFFEKKDAGLGDLSTNAFMADVRARARQAFGEDFAEKKICGQNNLCVDYHFPDEETIVEIALGLHNPKTEFEKDILKAIMAQEQGHSVRRLFFIAKPGGHRKCQQPGRRAFAAWALRFHGITIEIHDLTDPRSESE